MGFTFAQLPSAHTWIKLVEILDFVSRHLLDLPVLAKFAVALAIIVAVPPLSRRVRIPDVVGLLLAGVAIGPHGLKLIGQHHPIAELFAQLGILLLLFFAGPSALAEGKEQGLRVRPSHRQLAFGAGHGCGVVLRGPGCSRGRDRSIAGAPHKRC